MFNKTLKYSDLRDFITKLDELGELRRIKTEVASELEMTALADTCLQRGGPALLIEKPTLATSVLMRRNSPSSSSLVMKS
ncbi:MAG: hypothetical protein EBX02_01430, partial [Betaproteobacteria bacterium]|nr:hypothetical protein [Betaproteobacteria bacterium]